MSKLILVQYHFEILRSIDIFPDIHKQYQNALVNMSKVLSHHPLHFLLKKDEERFNVNGTMSINDLVQQIEQNTHPVPNDEKLPGVVYKENIQAMMSTKEYFKKYGFSISMTRYVPSLSSIVKQGIPNGLRAIIWFYLSGAAHLMLSYPPSYYNDLRVMRKDESTVAKQEIERDLHRSLPEHFYYKSEEGRNALRNVLTAFSWHNPSIGML